MASLLDLVVAEKNPRLAGLLGVNPQQRPQTAQRAVSSPSGGQPTPVAPANALAGGAGGAVSALGDVFAGQRDPALSPESNQAARRQALIMAGLATLASEREGLAAIAEGGLTGQAVGQQARQSAREAAEKARQALVRARVGQLVSGEDGDISREDAKRAFQMAVAAGDTETAKSLNSFLGNLPVPEEPEVFEPETVNLADGTVAVFDPNTGAFFDAAGQVLTELPQEIAGEDDKVQFVQGVDPASGDPVSGVVNLDRATFTPIDGIADAQSGTPKKVDDDAIDAAKEAKIGRKNLRTLTTYLDKKIEENPKNPLSHIRYDRARFEQTGKLVPFVFRQNLDTETQQFLQAQESFMLQLANELAGVRGVSSQSARGAIFRTFGFEQGDSAENIRNTLRELEIRVKANELKAGDALSLFDKVGLSPEGGDEANPFNQ